MKLKNSDMAWQALVDSYNLAPQQVEKFALYLELLKEWNQKFNLTAIDSDAEIIKYHFADSLILSQKIDLNAINSLADIGSGAGFPGLPLKILAPHLKVVLIEVTGKKVEFLQHVIQVLDLKDVEVEQLDWRNFLRQSSKQIELFCARASLPVVELLRIFKPSSPYQNSKLVYWASAAWWREPKNTGYGALRYDYKIGERNLTLAIFEKFKD